MLHDIFLQTNIIFERQSPGRTKNPETRALTQMFPGFLFCDPPQIRMGSCSESGVGRFFTLRKICMNSLPVMVSRLIKKSAI